MEGFGICIAMMAGWALAGVAGGAAGIGTGMTALPLVLLLLPPEDVIFVTTLGGFGAAVHLVFAYRRAFRWGDMRSLVAGCLPGIAAGALTLKFVPLFALQSLLGFVLLSFLVFQLFRGRIRMRLPQSPLAGAATGFLCGFASASVAIPGAPLGIYVILSGWDADRSRGNMSLFFVFIMGLSVLAQASTGLYSMRVLGIGMSCAVGSMLGQCIGVRLGRGMDTSILHRFILFFICAAACMLFWRALGL